MALRHRHPALARNPLQGWCAPPKSLRSSLCGSPRRRPAGCAAMRSVHRSSLPRRGRWQSPGRCTGRPGCSLRRPGTAPGPASRSRPAPAGPGLPSRACPRPFSASSGRRPPGSRPWHARCGQRTRFRRRRHHPEASAATPLAELRRWRP